MFWKRETATPAARRSRRRSAKSLRYFDSFRYHPNGSSFSRVFDNSNQFRSDTTYRLSSHFLDYYSNSRIPFFSATTILVLYYSILFFILFSLSHRLSPRVTKEFSSCFANVGAQHERNNRHAAIVVVRRRRR